MATVTTEAPALTEGEVLARDEFLRRWETLPGVKFAELLRGVVHMPWPLSLEHGDRDNDPAMWLGVYRSATPGCAAANNTTILMGEDSAPQPDSCLRLLPEYGGQTRVEGAYAAGAPEFVAEVSASIAARDLGEKLALYETEGVREYLVELVWEGEVRWYRRESGRLAVVPPPTDGIYRSSVFPGLWLDAAALLVGDLARVLIVLEQGLKSPEHAAFVVELAARRRA